jgi:putative membrane protein insertion efficiency factor
MNLRIIKIRLASISIAGVVLLLRAYKRFVSPSLSPACRYVPTCSEYSLEAVERFGVVRGSWMAIGRVFRCHPLAGSGYDPVMKHARSRHNKRYSLIKKNSPNIETAVTES